MLKEPREIHIVDKKYIRYKELQGYDKLKWIAEFPNNFVFFEYKHPLDMYMEENKISNLSEDEKYILYEKLFKEDTEFRSRVAKQARFHRHILAPMDKNEDHIGYILWIGYSSYMYSFLYNHRAVDFVSRSETRNYSFTDVSILMKKKSKKLKIAIMNFIDNWSKEEIIKESMEKIMINEGGTDLDIQVILECQFDAENKLASLYCSLDKEFGKYLRHISF